MNQIVSDKNTALAEAVAMSGLLPSLVKRAADTLANATSAAEVLEAKAEANLAYDAAKAASRFARAKGAFDEVVGAVYRAQADALEIEAMAKRRLADEYDKAQGPGGGMLPPSGGKNRVEGVPTRSQSLTKIGRLKDIGVSADDVWRARQARDAERAAPGVVRHSLDSIIERGDEPTKSALGREINTRLGSYSGDNEWYTPSRYVELARVVLGTIDLDPASNSLAQKVVKATTFYTVEDNGLEKHWCGKVWMNPPYSNPEIQDFTGKLIEHHLSGGVSEAIVLTNNSADTAWYHAMLDAASALCLTRGRIRFESPTRSSNSPAMGQAFFYFGNNPKRFAEVFAEVGFILERSKHYQRDDSRLAA